MPESSFVRTGGELRLNNLGQLELLRGMAGRGKPLRTRVRGFSMSPFILNGDIITIAPLNGRVPEVGEVVAFTLPESGRLAVHRIITAAGGGWLMSGDNSPEPDGVIGRERMIGHVTAVERNGRLMRLGLGAERRLVAWMVRHGLLRRLNAFRRMPGRVATTLLHSIQSLKTYRRVARRLRPRVKVAASDVAETNLIDDGFESTPFKYADPQVTTFIARHGAKSIGSVRLVRHPDAVSPLTGYWIFSMKVRSVYRGSGIGEMMTRFAVNKAIEEGAKELSLLVFSNNIPAISLYRKMGFERGLSPELETKLEEEERQTGRRIVVMSRRLIPGL
jgi:ribosomal protein S18 acetylase RimI-like enzyme